MSGRITLGEARSEVDACGLPRRLRTGRSIVQVYFVSSDLCAVLPDRCEIECRRWIIYDQDITNPANAPAGPANEKH